ncbi:MAG: glycosyltransferase, partial [Thiobacillus sp.]
ATYLKDVYLDTVQGTADSFMHFVGMQHAKLWQFGFLADIREIPLQFVPSSLFGFERDRGIVGKTSEFFLGHPLAQGLSGEEPPGLHGYLLVNFGYFGMFLLFFLLGLAYKLLDNAFRPKWRNDAVAWLIYWWIFFMFLEFFREGAIILELKARASWWLAIGLLIYSNRNFKKTYSIVPAWVNFGGMNWSSPIPQPHNNTLFLVRSLDRGGAERQLVTLVKGLAHLGHTVSVAVFYGGGAYEPELFEAGVHIINLNKRGRWDVLPFLYRMVILLRNTHPAVLHSYLGVPNILAVILKPMLPNTRIVWGVRASDMDLDRYDWLSRVSYRIECWLSRFADLIICNSHAGMEYATTHNFPRAKMMVIQNGIDTEHFKPDAIARVHLRKTWGVAENKILVGLTARLDPMKDHPTFLRAAAMLGRGNPDIRFVCVGNGPEPYKAELHRLATKLGLDEKLIWAGACSDMPAVFNALDIAVSSSLYGEGFSNAIGEAMACGVPCVATDVGDARDILGDCGVIVAPNNPEALIDGILVMLERIRTEGAQLSQLNRMRIVNNFSVETLIQHTQAALESVY